VKFHEAIARMLGDHGVRALFGVLGDANLYMAESFVRQVGGKFYSMSHECGAVLAANGYARTSGALGVATVTHGPALTNTVTALVDCAKGRTPLLLVAGDTAAGDVKNVQSISQRDIVLPTGAGFEQVRSADTVATDLAEAVKRATVERRPIVLNVPIEFQWLDVDYAPAAKKLMALQATKADPAIMDRVVGAIASSRRPLLLAGHGAVTPHARAALLRLAMKLGAPLATTLRGMDLWRGEPHNLGVFGTLSHDVAIKTISQSDCIIAFGASLNDYTTADGSYLANKTVVHVDVDRAAFRTAGDDIDVVGDAATVADDLDSWLDELALRPTGFASPQLAERLATASEHGFADRSADQHVDIRTAILRVERALPEERTLVLDAGRFALHAWRLMHVPKPRAYVHTASFGSIGMGMGNAVGAALGAPERPVVLVIGDGGLMLGGLTEFSSAVRHKLDVVVVLLNDSAYGAEYVQLERRELDPSIATFEWPDFGPLATAMGGRGFTVRSLSDLDEALDAIGDRDRPILIDIKLDPEEVPMLAY
jgi:thiamine pyrophosphate-dependent acetolactate synthase large subunit-like protein